MVIDINRHLMSLAVIVALTQTPNTLFALEYEADSSWITENPAFQYYYISFVPNEENISTLMDTLIAGKWVLDLTRQHNSNLVFTGRIRTSDKAAPPPNLPYSREWAKDLNLNSLQAYKIKAHPTELNMFFENMGKKGYVPAFVGHQSDEDVFQYAFVRK